MSETMEIQRETNGDVLTLKLKGNITEDSQIEELKKDLKPNVILDLEHVDRINSYGIRQWINVMKEIRAQVQNLVFHHCPPIIVEQFNMINNFGAGGTVYSIYLPYYCDNCSRDELKLFPMPDGKSPEGTPTLPSYSCGKCSSPLTFNDIEDEYFYFLQHQKGAAIPAPMLDQLRKSS